MQVNTTYNTYQQVLEYLDTAKKVYKLIKQKYKDDVSISFNGKDFVYTVTITVVHESTQE